MACELKLHEVIETKNKYNKNKSLASVRNQSSAKALR